MSIKISKTAITHNGERCGVCYSAGPWVAGVDPTTIKIRPRRNGSFPASFRQAFAVENNSDAQIDFFEKDCIRVALGHPLYAAVKIAASAGTAAH